MTEETAGFIEIAAYPNTYNAKRIASIPEAAAAVRQNEVMLRGWNFPHTDRDNSAPFSTGFQSTTEWGPYVERYRMYLSGLFVWKRHYWEDIEDKRDRNGRRLLSFISLIWSFTEYFIFLSRLYERIAADEAIHIVITLHGCAGRDLASMDVMVPFFGGYVAGEDVIKQERDVHVSDLRASHLAIAAEMVKRVFHVFGWLDVRDETIASWQQKLIKRQF